MILEADASVRELLSDEQIESVELQVASGEAVCVHCGDTIDPDLGPGVLILLVDAANRRAAARVAHAGCGSSEVLDAALPGPGAARLAERWAAFVLPRVPVAVLEARASVWVGEDGPALIEMLRHLGFENARELLDSELFATGVGPPPHADGLIASSAGDDLVLALEDGSVLESLPGALAGDFGALVQRAGGVAIALGTTLGLPASGEEPLAFEPLLPALLDRAVGAFVPIAPASGDPHGGRPS